MMDTLINFIVIIAQHVPLHALNMYHFHCRLYLDEGGRKLCFTIQCRCEKCCEQVERCFGFYGSSEDNLAGIPHHHCLQHELVSLSLCQTVQGQPVSSVQAATLLG
jgi:hypothetical protein